MRKEDEADTQERDAEAVAEKPTRKPVRRVELEEEVAEDDLLGEATLAKLNASRDETEEESEDTTSEKSEETAAEENKNEE